MAGVKGELPSALRPDLFVMDAKAREIVSILHPIRGVTDLDYTIRGLPQLQVVIDRAATPATASTSGRPDGIEAATKGRVSPGVRGRAALRPRRAPARGDDHWPR